MAQAASRSVARRKRHSSIRLRLEGTTDRPRLAVFRSLQQIYAQVIDDTTGRTLASASSLEAALRESTGTKSEVAHKVGSLVADRARAAGIQRVVFDRAGFRYHGRIKALADGARASGLDF